MAWLTEEPEREKSDGSGQFLGDTIESNRAFGCTLSKQGPSLPPADHIVVIVAVAQITAHAICSSHRTSILHEISTTMTHGKHKTRST